MKKTIWLALPAFAWAVMSCGTASTTDSAAAKQDSTYAPVETKDPNTDYPPAFEGQTRAPGVRTSTPYEATVITESLKRPWGIGLLPDGRFLITEKEGTLRIVTGAGEISEPIKGVPEVDADGQGGLLGIKVDPNFSENRMVYWVFSEKQGNKGNLTAVAKGRLSDDETSLEGVQVIYRATPAYKGRLHYGGRIIFDNEGNLLVSTGERSDKETRPQAQDLNSGLGKIVRIDTDGNAVKGNPFEGRSDARPEIYSYGHRNVQGIAIHPVTGDLWETEFGPRGGDELNRIEPGKNYGWPIITYGIEYSGAKIGDSIQVKEGMEQPVYYWDPVLSPSGLTFYTGNRIPEWENNLFAGGLSSMHIARLVIENNRVVGEERLLEDEKQRFRDVIQGNDGALYAITDNGRFYKIDKK